MVLKELMHIQFRCHPFYKGINLQKGMEWKGHVIDILTCHSWTDKLFDFPSIYTWQAPEVCNFPQAILILIDSFCQIRDIHMKTT